MATTLIDKRRFDPATIEAADAEEEKPPTDPVRVCTNCVFCRTESRGYSEWTITGEEVYCAFGLFVPFESEDNSYDSKLAFANECPHFRKGLGLHISMGGEDENVREIRDWISLTVKPEQAP